MDNKNVSANRLREIANEIEGKAKETESYISQIQKDANTVITVCREMESYEGKGVEGSLNHTVGKQNENGETPWTYSWSIWNIKGASEKKSEAAELNRKVANVKVVLQNLCRLARKMQGSADDISLYQSLIEGLNWKDNDPIFSSTFDILAGHIAWDEYSAASGNFEGVDPNNIKYWTDKPLRFTRNETTGAYLIEQQDENGNWVGMGFTDETTAVQYMKAFNSKVNMADSSTDLNVARQEQLDARKFNELSSAAQKLKASGTLLGLAVNGAYAGLQKLARGLKNYLVKEGYMSGNVSSVNTSWSYGNQVSNAKAMYQDEISNAYKSYVSDNTLVTVNKVELGGNPGYFVRVVRNDSSQLKRGFANGAYASGREGISDLGKRYPEHIVGINASHFDYDDGSQDVNVGAKTVRVAISNNNVIETDVTGIVNENNVSAALQATTGGDELCIKNNGELMVAPKGVTAQQLIEQYDVKDTISAQDGAFIINGQINPAYDPGNFKEKTVLAQTRNPGEEFILVGKASNEEMTKFLLDKGAYNAKSMDQGGSTELIYNDNGKDIVLYNGYNHEDGGEERGIGEMLYFTD